jgi:hypothetical protein
MTFVGVSRLFAFWRRNPPLRLMFAAFCGIKLPLDPPVEKKYMTADDMRRLMTATGGKIPGVQRR